MICGWSRRWTHILQVSKKNELMIMLLEKIILICSCFLSTGRICCQLLSVSQKVIWYTFFSKYNILQNIKCVNTDVLQNHSLNLDESLYHTSFHVSSLETNIAIINKIMQEFLFLTNDSNYNAYFYYFFLFIYSYDL